MVQYYAETDPDTETHTNNHDTASLSAINMCTTRGRGIPTFDNTSNRKTQMRIPRQRYITLADKLQTQRNKNTGTRQTQCNAQGHIRQRHTHTRTQSDTEAEIVRQTTTKTTLPYHNTTHICIDRQINRDKDVNANTTKFNSNIPRYCAIYRHIFITKRRQIQRQLTLAKQTH